MWASWNGKLGEKSFKNLKLSHEVVKIRDKAEIKLLMSKKKESDPNIGSWIACSPRLGKLSEIDGTARAMEENLRFDLDDIHRIGLYGNTGLLDIAATMPRSIRKKLISWIKKG